MALLREVSPSVDCGTVGCGGTLVLAARVRLLWSEVLQLHVKAFDKKLSSLQIETIGVFLDEEIPCLLLEIDDVLVLHGLYQLFQKPLLEYLEFLLVGGRESHACLWETPDVPNLDFIAALFEPLFGLALHVEDLFLHRGVPVVLDRVVRATFEGLGNFSPLVLLEVVLCVKNELFFETPLVFLDSRVQVIVPSLPTLLADATRQVLCDRGPFLSPSGLDKRQDKLIFLFTPRSLDQLWVEYLLPSMEALDVCSTA